MYDVQVPRLVDKEGGRFPFDFDQRERYAGVPPIIIQGLLVAAERKRRVKIPLGTPREPRLAQTRQSRITVALETADPKFSYRPAKSDNPDIGVRFGRENAAASLAGRGLDSRPALATAKRRKTTTSLSGQPPLEPTHKLIDLNVPFGTVAVALFQAPSEFKLETLTTGGGSLGFADLRQRYQKLLAERNQAAAVTTATATPSIDLLPEIPW